MTQGEDLTAQAPHAQPRRAGGSRRGLSRRSVVVAAAGLSVGGAGALLAVLRRPSTTAPAAPPAPSTGTITRTTLVDVMTVQGQLAYGPELGVESRLAGTVTELPPVGKIVSRGQVLFRIDDTPVVLLYGRVPAYRTLTAGRRAADPASTPGAGEAPPGQGQNPPGTVPASHGADVKQFEDNLRALGYREHTPDDRYNSQTASAVRRWQEKLGLAQTGEVELGRVVYAPGPVRIAKHEITPGSVATGPLVRTTGATRLVTALVPARNQAIVKAATKVTISLADGTEVTGTVSAVSTAAEGQPGASQEPMLDVVLRLDDPASVDGLDDGPARVRFVVQERADVLVVPVGALLALAEGGFGLQLLEPGGSRVVAVTTGLFADGKVEVSGPDLREGTTVGMAR
ncbi:peptidoglycan-binding domain-containing protein [Catellatospora methionotrophica]|uniref:peptidoglycan-binding domain-containing protein n=1 Tax=Catellatospora methionotrophica TaxID=121620 RepID=UPI0033E132E3